MSGGDFTQMGKAVGSGGGVQRIIDTNIKRVPANAVHFNPEGGVSLASLGLTGPEAENIIRQSIRLQPVGEGQYVDAGFVGAASTGEMFTNIYEIYREFYTCSTYVVFTTESNGSSLLQLWMV